MEEIKMWRQFPLFITDMNTAHLIIDISEFKVAVNPIPGRSTNSSMNSKLAIHLYL